MKYLSKTIEQGAKIAGDQKQLETQLELAKGYITEVKAGRRGLPTEACFKLADLTGADLVRLIAENEAITAKAGKAEFWKKKLVEIEKLAACVLVGVNLFVTPTPSEAAPMLQIIDSTVYIKGITLPLNDSRPARDPADNMHNQAIKKAYLP